MRTFLFLLGMLIVLQSSTCDRNDDGCTVQDYIVEIPLSVSPAIDTFAVGDTIWVESIHTNKLYELNTEDSVTLVNGFDVVVSCIPARLDTATAYSAVDEFDLISAVGDITVQDLATISSWSIAYEFEDSQRGFRGGVIPKESGLYMVSFSQRISRWDNINAVEDGECLDMIYSHFAMNNGGNNYELLSHSADESYVTLSKEGFDQEGGYVFVVTQ